MKNRLIILRGFGRCLCIALLLCSLLPVGVSIAQNEGKATLGARTALSKDALKLPEGKGKDVYYSKNMKTGEITANELDPEAFKDVHEILPYIPEGLEVAEPIKAGSKAIIGNDDRVQISEVNRYPYCATAIVTSQYSNGNKTRNTGVFVSPTTILTAGEVAYDENDGWAVNTTVIPGGDFSIFDPITATETHSIYGWIEKSYQSYDIGLVRIADSAQTGYFGVKVVDNESLTGQILNYGYPDDLVAGQLYSGAGNIGSVFFGRFYHNADTAYGNGGGPIVLNSDQHTIVGLHYGPVDDYNNFAFRITKRVLNFILNNLD